MPKNPRHAVRTVALLLVVAVGGGLLSAAAVAPLVGAAGVATRDAAKTFDNLPVPTLSQLPTGSRILDSKGHVIAYYYPNLVYRIPVPFDQISTYMRKAIVAIEDDRFWKRSGAFDLRATIRALVSTASGRQVQGGSDIAQQYVKNALELTGTPAQRAAATAGTLTRKIRELRMATIVQHQLSKQQLLAAYLNAIPFSNFAVGIQVAAETYFSTTAVRLNLAQSALLAGIVNSPSTDNPLVFPGNALARRTVVLKAMQQQGYISKSAERAAEAAPIGLRPSNQPVRQGCTASSVRESSSWFCAYVLAVMKNDPAYKQALDQLNYVGGLTIHTTMDAQDQRAAQHAVSYMVPPPPSNYNPGGNAATEVLIQPGTGYIRAIAEDRPWGYNAAAGQTVIDYAVDEQYGGGFGVQTGSSSKLFTLLTALKQNYPLGSRLKVKNGMVVSGFSSCKGLFINPYQVFNSDPAENGTYTLYNGTTRSVNAFYVSLEQRVGLCQVVRTAASLGLHRGDGKSLFVGVHDPGGLPQSPADGVASFTLGSVNVAPMSMAAAYATVAARGIACHPIAITSITSDTGRQLPVESAHCHRVLRQEVADAANFVLQGVLTAAGATGIGDGLSVPAAAKTGTGDLNQYIAFAGYTPRLVGYVSWFNPKGPVANPLIGNGACYRASPSYGGSLACAGSLFGKNAGEIWQYTFEHANLGHPAANFVPLSPYSQFLSQGDGNIAPIVPKPPKPPKPPKKPGPSPPPTLPPSPPPHP